MLATTMRTSVLMALAAACGGGNNNPAIDATGIDGTGLPPATTTFSSVAITSLPGASMNAGVPGIFMSGAPAAGSGTAPAISNTVASAFSGAPAKPIFVSQAAPFDAVIITVTGQSGFFSIPAGSNALVGLDLVANATVSTAATLSLVIDPNIFVAAGDLENHDTDGTNVADLFGAFLEGRQGMPAMPMQITDGHNNNADTLAGVKGLVGPVATGHREVVWDGVPEDQRNLTNFSATFFDRQVAGTEGVQGGVIFKATGGTGEQVNDALATVLPDPATVGPPNNPNAPLGGDFSNLNPAYAGNLIAFTQNAEFAPLGTTTTDVTFHVASTMTKGFVIGFGVVFTSVDKAQASSLEFFDQNDVSIVKVFVPLQSRGPYPFAGPVAGTPGNIPFSFAGYIDRTKRIGRVRITNGEVPVDTATNDNPGGADVVVIDDIYYGEPRP